MEQLKATIKDVRTCNHTNEFSLTIEVGNNMTQFTSYCYTQAGNRHQVTFFELQVEDMYELAEKIIQAANKIRKVEVA